MRAWRARRRREAEELKKSVLRLRKRVVDLEQENRELKVG
jgi:polyhydroxyalkanoate synthesis regulator phasin